MAKKVESVWSKLIKKMAKTKKTIQKGGGDEPPSWSWLIIGLLFGVLITLLIVIFFWQTKTNKNDVHTTIINEPNRDPAVVRSASYSALPPEPKVYPNELPRDVSSLRIGTPTRVVDIRGTPVNTHTRGEPPAYQQLGMLLSDRSDGLDEPIMLPLFGRPIYVGSSKFEYYAASDKQHMMRIPISVENRSCSKDTGCNELYDGDSVYVPTYKRNFTVTLYEKDAPRYIPYI